ncbi:MAG TPA: cyclin-dependent kinase inhibitor 3 family protein [Dongiaceae bacterium]|jgi:ADP-ribosyl-[dinitrogen reductase] hydrolase
MLGYLIDELPVAGGRLGLCCCPGHRLLPRFVQPSLPELERDLDVIAKFGATSLVTLMEADELRLVGIDPERLQREITARGLAWLHAPIRNLGIPELPWEERWSALGKDLRAELGRGGRIAMHCYAGLGRTGTIAARLLIETGMTPNEAIALVRRIRPGSIETPQQEFYVRDQQWRQPGAP